MADAVRYYGTGKRKNAIARVWLFEGDGSIEVNKKGVLEYFCRRTLEALINLDCFSVLLYTEASPDLTSVQR